MNFQKTNKQTIFIEKIIINNFNIFNLYLKNIVTHILFMKNFLKRHKPQKKHQKKTHKHKPQKKPHKKTHKKTHKKPHNKTHKKTHQKGPILNKKH